MKDDLLESTLEAITYDFSRRWHLPNAPGLQSRSLLGIFIASELGFSPQESCAISLATPRGARSSLLRNIAIDVENKGYPSGNVQMQIFDAGWTLYDVGCDFC